MISKTLVRSYIYLLYHEFALVNRNSWGGDPESLGANRSAYYPRDHSLFV